MKFLKRFEPQSYALFRIVFGVLFAFHGAQKLFGVYFDYPRPEWWTQAWFGGVIEFFGGIAIALGLFTRPLAFLCSGTMAVAYFQFHWKSSPLEAALFPAVNQGEMAVLYCFAFLFIACRGSGIWALRRD